jgi:hypothetical protein
MDGPSATLLLQIPILLADVSDLVDDSAEGRLTDALGVIETELGSDLAGGWDETLDEDAAFDLLGAIDSWASLISGAVARIYAPASPFKPGFGGWSKAIGKRLRWLTNLLLAPLRTVANVLNASSYSIGLNFPWGVSVGLNWP